MRRGTTTASSAANHAAADAKAAAELEAARASALQAWAIRMGYLSSHLIKSPLVNQVPEHAIERDTLIL